MYLKLWKIMTRQESCLFRRKRIDITLSVETINKLKKLSKKTGKPISRIIEERVED